MKKVTKLQVNDWYGKKFTSADHLNELAKSKGIKCDIVHEKQGFDWTIYTYRFSTHDGREIAIISRESGWGFSSQAYGIELKNVTSLVPDFRRKIDADVWMNDVEFLQNNRKYHVLRRLAKGQSIKQYYYAN